MQRKLNHSLFRQNNFLNLVETTSQQKVEMGLFKILDHASQNGLQVDMQDLFQRFTVDVTCKFLLGSDLNSLSVNLPEVPFALAIDDIEEVLLHRHVKPRSLWKLQNWLQVGLEKKATKAITTIDSFINQQISLKQELHRKRTVKGGAKEEGFDLVSNFMMDEVAAKCTSSEKSLETFLRDSVLSILIAGRDTSSTALTWFLWIVSTNPLVKSKIREELQVTFQMKEGDQWRFPSGQELNELIYLHASLCETLRLYPPVPFNHKASVKSDILPSGHRVNKETAILISMYAMGRMKEIWGADCCEFKPERWISEKGSILNIPSYKFNVFGAGPRTCLGKDLALREMKIAAAAIIWNYDLEIVKDHPVIAANSVILHMQHGLKVRVTKRCKF
uniref:Cytochrome P450 n=1 Tax=Kalanchoe fedtschenkoi TaxID=63787 RepID=A0A7N0SWS9_KALFE